MENIGQIAFVITNSDEHKRLISTYYRQNTGIYGWITWETNGVFSTLKFTKF